MLWAVNPVEADYWLGGVARAASIEQHPGERRQ